LAFKDRLTAMDNYNYDVASNDTGLTHGESPPNIILVVWVLWIFPSTLYLYLLHSM